MKLGIFGGTFNPIHLAHLQVAQESLVRCGLDQVLFLVAADPPHKPVLGGASFADRLAMVEQALKDHRQFVPCDLENRLPGINYTVQTLEHLQRQHAGDCLYFIVGLDSFRDFATWRDYRRILDLSNLIVVHRPGIYNLDPQNLLPVAMQNQFCYSSASRSLEQANGNSIIFCEETCHDISSTVIRQRVAAGDSIVQLVPTAVANYITAHRLYRADST